MENTSWLKQADEPLFPDMLWSRPENKRQAGKLLVIGGNKHGFAVPAAAYSAAQAAGIGSCRAMLPESLRKTVGSLFEADFAPANPSGSFSKAALANFLEHAAWADGVLLAGNFGRNSETAIVLDLFIEKYSGLLVVADDALDYFINKGSPVLSRDKTTLVINLGKLQKFTKNNSEMIIRHQDNLAETAAKLAELSQVSGLNYVARHADKLIVAASGQVSTTAWKEDSRWQTELPAYISVWQIQNPQKPFEAITTAVSDFATA